MGMWRAPRPGGTRTPVARPAGTLVAAPAPAGTRLLVPRPGGSRWHTAAPAGTRWAHALQPPLPIPTEIRTADLSGTGTLSTFVIPVIVQGAGFTADAVLSVAITERLALAAALAGSGTLTLQIQVIGEMFEAAGPFSGSGTLSAGAFPRFGPLGADLSGSGALSAVTFPRHTRAADLSGVGALSAVTFPRHAQGAAFAGAGTLSVVVQVVPQRGADLSGTGVLGVLTFPRHIQAADLNGAGTLSVTIVQKTDWTDDFNRSNGAIGSNWTTFAIGADATVVPEINSNALRAKSTATNNQNNQCFALATGTGAQCLTDTMATRAQMLAGENGLFMAAMARASVDGQNFVMAVITSDSASTGIWSRIAGAYVRRTTTVTTVFAANDYFELSCTGNVYTLIRNPQGTPSTISTWTDTGNLYPVGVGKRYGGIYHNSDRNSLSTQNWAPAVDNFRVRDL